MRIAVQDSPIFTRMDLEQGFATLHNCGFQGMDFSLGRWFNLKQLRPDETAVLDMPIEEVLRQAEPFRAAAQKHGIAFTQTHAPFPTWLPDNDPMNERLIAALQRALPQRPIWARPAAWCIPRSSRTASCGCPPRKNGN